MPDPESPTGKTEKGLKAGVRLSGQDYWETRCRLEGNRCLEQHGVDDWRRQSHSRYGQGVQFGIGVHVPLIVVGGRKWVTWQGKTGCLTDFSDIYPTCLELAGVDVKSRPDLSGKSFKPLLDGDRTYSRPWILSSDFGAPTIRDRQWCLDSYGQLWRCNESGSPFTFDPITQDKENDETARGRAALKAVLATLPGATRRYVNDEKTKAGREKMMKLYERYKGLAWARV